MEHFPFVGLRKVQFDVVRFCRLHNEQVSAFQRIRTAFDMERAGAFDKIKEFDFRMGMQHKTGLIRIGTQSMREIEIIV